MELGIDSAALDAIERNYANNHRRLIAMIELWHISIDLKPSREAMETVLRSNRVTLSEIGGCIVPISGVKFHYTVAQKFSDVNNGPQPMCT